MSALTAKLGALALLLLSSLLLGLLPFPLRSWLRDGAGRGRRARLALSCLQCLGGGVLLATVLTHMLPEIRESLEAGGRGGSFPLAEALLCAGMFSIYAVEELALLLSPGTGNDSDDGDSHPSMLQGTGDDKTAASEDVEADGDAEPCRSHCPAAATRGGGRLAAFRVIIVTIALSVHSVFEGVAIGLTTSQAKVWLLTAAIATHKGIIAFCLGEQLAVTQRRLRPAICSLLAFVTATPLGIAIGLLVMSTGSGDAGSKIFTTDILQALAAGTILYVVLFEIIQGERAKPGGGLVKLVAILAGFGIMLLVQAFIREPEHGPSSAHHPVERATDTPTN